MIKVITFLGILALTPLAASAQSFQDHILTQLADQGFHDFEVSKTLLGRIRVISQSETLHRELVFNPVTGEILRDYWEVLPNSGAQSPRVILTNPSNNDHDDNTSAPNANVDPNGSNHPRDEDEDVHEHDTDADNGGDDGHDDGHEDEQEDDDKNEDDK